MVPKALHYASHTLDANTLMWVGVGTLASDSYPSVVIVWRESRSISIIAQITLAMDSTFTTAFGDTYDPFSIIEYNARSSTQDDSLVVMHRDNTRGSVLIVDYDSNDIDLYEIGSASDMLEVQSFI